MKDSKQKIKCRKYTIIFSNRTKKEELKRIQEYWKLKKIARNIPQRQMGIGSQLEHWSKRAGKKINKK